LGANTVNEGAEMVPDFAHRPFSERNRNKKIEF